MPSAVAMSNVTPPASAGAERLTVNVNDVVPELPSFSDTSSIERLGTATEFRGFGAPAVKSLPLLSVSVAPLPARRSDVEALIVGAGATPSKQFVPVP